MQRKEKVLRQLDSHQEDVLNDRDEGEIEEFPRPDGDLCADVLSKQPGVSVRSLTVPNGTRTSQR